MRPLPFIRRNPLLVLGAFVAAFAVWVGWDAGTEPAAGDSADGPPLLVRAPPEPLYDAEELRPVPHATAQTLPKLRPGMARTEVEGLVGAPSADDISPATVSDGRVTYRMSYEADLAPPSTVRPLPGRRPAPAAGGAGRTLVTLEFDASKPGHPLVGVHYPDPLF